MLLQGYACARIYAITRKHSSPKSGTAADGASFGLRVAALLGAAQTLATVAHNPCEDEYTFIALEGLYCLIQFVVSGVCIALAHGKGDDTPPGDGLSPRGFHPVGFLGFIVPYGMLAAIWHGALFEEQIAATGAWKGFPDSVRPEYGMTCMIIHAAVAADWMGQLWLPHYTAGARQVAELGLYGGVLVFTVSVLSLLAKMEVDQPGSFVLIAGAFLLTGFPMASFAAGYASARPPKQKGH